MPLLLALIALLFSALPALSQASPQVWPDVLNSAEVLESYITVNPQLITPSDRSVTRNRFEQFSWYQAQSSSGINHYEFYLDGLKYADDIYPHTPRDTSVFVSSVTSEKVFFTVKTALPEGRHTWMVRAVSSGDLTADSQTWSFTVDTTNPLIILQAVDDHTMYWASHDPASIPPFDKRRLIITSPDPLLSGKVEANANLKLALVCLSSIALASDDPSDALQSSCTDQVIIITDTDGNWQHRFYSLSKNVVYQAYLSATDAAGNSTYFPVFTLVYQPRRIWPFPPPPTPTGIPVEPGVPPTIAPSGPHIPEEFPVDRGDQFRVAPPPPPYIFPQTHPPSLYTLIPKYLNTLIIFGLVLHLAMAVVAAAVPLLLIPRFLFLLLLPFLGQKTGLTLRENTGFLPFTLIRCYSPDSSPSLKKTVISDILGRFHLPPGLFFIKAFHPGYDVFSQLVTVQTAAFNNLLPNRFPLQKQTPQTIFAAIRQVMMTLRLLPLLIALLTALYAVAVAKVITPYLLAYLLLSLLYFFSEYLYPHLPHS